MSVSSFSLLLRSLILVLQIAAVGVAPSYAREPNKSVEWTEEVLLHDGRVISVGLKATDTYGIDYSIPLVFHPVLRKLSTTEIKFVHPDSGAHIGWSGEEYLRPVLVDFVEGVPFMVVYGRPDKKLSEKYGCPELPYIYLKYRRWAGWEPVPVEKAPVELVSANLSALEVDDWDDGKSITQTRVAQRIANAERRSGHRFQARIPRTYDEWDIRDKNGARNNRGGGDCRPPPDPIAPLTLPAPTEASVEVMESIEYDPVRVFSKNEWVQFFFDQPRSSACKSLFRFADEGDQFLGQRFVEDPSGSKAVPYVVNGQRLGYVATLCDDYIWFVNHSNETPFQLAVTKYSRQGDLVYRIGIRMPESLVAPGPHYSQRSVASHDGYLYFDWVLFTQERGPKLEPEWHVRRILKLRAKEPDLVR